MAAIIFRFQSIDLRDHAIEWDYRSNHAAKKDLAMHFIKIYDVKNFGFCSG